MILILKKAKGSNIFKNNINFLLFTKKFEIFAHKINIICNKK